MLKPRVHEALDRQLEPARGSAVALQCCGAGASQSIVCANYALASGGAVQRASELSENAGRRRSGGQSSGDEVTVTGWRTDEVMDLWMNTTMTALGTRVTRKVKRAL